MSIGMSDEYWADQEMSLAEIHNACGKSFMDCRCFIEDCTCSEDES